MHGDGPFSLRLLGNLCWRIPQTNAVGQKEEHATPSCCFQAPLKTPVLTKAGPNFPWVEVCSRTWNILEALGPNAGRAGFLSLFCPSQQCDLVLGHRQEAGNRSGETEHPTSFNRRGSGQRLRGGMAFGRSLDSHLLG